MKIRYYRDWQDFNEGDLMRFASAISILIAAICGTSQAEIPQSVVEAGYRVVHLSVIDPDGGISSGSGVVVDREWIFTCFHLVRDAGGVGTRVTVRHEGDRWTATTRMVDQARDFAALQLHEPRGVKPLELARAKAGDQLYASGHPGGDRQAWWIFGTANNRYDGILAWDGSPATPGYSGGPAFDSQGRLVGIISASDGVRETMFAPLWRVAESQALPKSFVEMQCRSGYCVPPRKPNGRYLFPWNSRGNAAVSVAAARVQQRQPQTIRGPSGPQGEPGRDGLDGKPGPVGPAGEPGPTVTITSVEIEEIAAIIYARMSSEPKRWRGEKGDSGTAPPIEDIIAALPPVVISTVDKHGERQTISKPLGETITIRLVPE